MKCFLPKSIIVAFVAALTLLLSSPVRAVPAELDFSADHRTRVLFLAANLGRTTNGAFPTVSVAARDGGGAIHNLPVESIGEVIGFEWLTQVVVRLPDELNGAGPVQVSITAGGSTSNEGSIVIK